MENSCKIYNKLKMTIIIHMVFLCISTFIHTNITVYAKEKCDAKTAEYLQATQYLLPQNLRSGQTGNGNMAADGNIVTDTDADTDLPAGETPDTGTPSAPSEDTAPPSLPGKDLSGDSSYTDSQGITYTLYKNNICYVSGYTQNISASVCIPGEITRNNITYRVKGIFSAAFKQCRNLQTMELPGSMIDISADTFKGCTSLSLLKIIPVTFNTRTNGSTSVVRVSISQTLLSIPAKAELQIPENVLEKALENEKAGKIILKISVLPDAGNQVKAIPDSILLPPQVAKSIGEQNKALQTVVRNAAGTSYKFTVDASELEKASAPLNLSLIRLRTSDMHGNEKKDMQKVLRKNGSDGKKADIISFSLNKNPGISLKCTITAKSGSQAYVYRYHKTERTFVSLSYHPYTVTKNGTIQFTVSSAGIYMISPVKLTEMCRMPRSRFLTESGKTYYVNQQGELLYGWNRIGNEYYYFDRETASMASGTTVDGIAIQKDGTARKKTYYYSKIQTMIKARDIVTQITDSTDSKSEKIKKCFLWIFQFPYNQYRHLEPLYTKEGWEIIFANDIFDRHQGCCVSEASALAFMFHECGYPIVYICHDTGHAWVELNGRVYDPLFAEARGFEKYYNVSYPQYRLYPIGKLKI